MSRVMISYRQIPGQSEFADRLERELANAGFETWIDKKNIPPGSNWESEIFQGIIASDYVILCLSPEYFESQTCQSECYIARGYGKNLLPIVVPYEGRISVFELIGQYEATKGIDHLHIISFQGQEVLGLVEDYTLLVQRLAKAMTNPTPLDADYEVYCSFRWTQAEFATRIADDLNRAGIKTFIHTRSIDVGAEWRRASWSATLKARFHLVILSPDVYSSDYIGNEVLIRRTKKDTHFIPVLAQEFVNDKVAKDEILTTFRNSPNLAELNKIQWYVPDKGYQDLIDRLIKHIKTT